MGFFDALVAQKEANVASLKAQKALADAKIANLNSLHTLADEIQQRIQGTPGQENAMQNDPNAKVPLSPPQAAPNFGMPFSPEGKINPSVQWGTQATPGKSVTGNSLLDAIMPIVLKSGDIGNAAKIAEFASDPKRQLQQQMLSSSPVNMTPGQPNTTDMIADIIEKGKRGDKEALSYAAKLKGTVGIDLFPAIERAQKAEDVTYKEETLPSGAKRIVGINRRQQIVPLGQAPPQLGSSGLVKFDGSFKTQEDADKFVNALQKTQPGGITTQQGATEEPIKSTDLKNWINPITGKHPSQPAGTMQLQAQGFVPYEKLTGEQAPRFAKAVNSLDQLPQVSQYLFDQNGKLNVTNWAKMKAGIGEGARIKGILLQAAWAQIRNESGAAVTDKEVSDQANQYVTNLLSVTDPQGMYEGIQRLGADLKGYIDVIDPSGVHQITVRKNPYKLDKKKPSLSVGKPKTGTTKRKIGRFDVEVID